jgi:hypothetical protein
MGLERTKITFNSKHQWFGETAEGIKQYAKAFSDNEIKMKSEKDCVAFENLIVILYCIMPKLLRILRRMFFV